MKVKVIKEYFERDVERTFNVGEVINVENKENSLFYHIWEKENGVEKLVVIPKENCVVVKQEEIMSKNYIVNIKYHINANDENQLEELLKEMNISNNEYYKGYNIVGIEMGYKVGDKVAYLGVSKEYRTGTIREVEIADNGRSLYLITNYPYLRYGTEILGMLKDLEEEGLLQEEVMNTYQKAKESARNKAIEWQLDFNNHNYSYEELACYTEYFEVLARRYGLVKEFRRNGII